MATCLGEGQLKKQIQILRVPHTVGQEFGEEMGTVKLSERTIKKKNISFVLRYPHSRILMMMMKYLPLIIGFYSYPIKLLGRNRLFQLLKCGIFVFPVYISLSIITKDIL